MKAFLISIILLFFSNKICYCKSDSSKVLTGVSLSYFAESGYHHGFFTGVDLRLKNRNTIAKSGKLRNHQLILSPQVGFYNHPNNKNVLILETELSHRFTFNPGLFVQTGFGMGMLRTFYNLPAYQIVDDVLIEIKRAGMTAFAGSLLAGMGFDFSYRKKAPLTVQAQAEIYLQSPYNHLYVVFPSWQMKIVYYLNHKKQK